MATRNARLTARLSRTLASYPAAEQLASLVIFLTLALSRTIARLILSAGQWYATQRDYCRYCQGVSQDIDSALANPQSAPAGLTHSPYVITAEMAESLVIRPATSILMGAQTRLIKAREEKANATIPAPRKVTTTSKAKKAKAEKVSVAANAGIEVEYVGTGTMRYTEKGLMVMTVAQLRALATERNVKVTSKMRKAELANAIHAAQSN